MKNQNNVMNVFDELERLYKKQKDNPEEFYPSEQRELCYFQFLEQRNVEYVCHSCGGYGVRGYGSTATWGSGIGGQAITSDVCDNCWGSGDEYRHWPSWKQIKIMKDELKTNVSK